MLQPFWIFFYHSSLFKKGSCSKKKCFVPCNGFLRRKTAPQRTVTPKDFVRMLLKDAKISYEIMYEIIIKNIITSQNS